MFFSYCNLYDHSMIDEAKEGRHAGEDSRQIVHLQADRQAGRGIQKRWKMWGEKGVNM